MAGQRSSEHNGVPLCVDLYGPLINCLRKKITILTELTDLNKNLLLGCLTHWLIWAVVGLLSLGFYFGFWPLVYHLVILPKAVPEKHGLQVNVFDQIELKGKPSHSFFNTADKLTLEKPDTSLLAYGLWKVPQTGNYRIHLECDDFGSLSLDMQDLIQLTGINARNIGEIEVDLKRGYHLMVLRLFNRPEKGWLTLKTVISEESVSLLGGTSLVYLDLPNLNTWLKVEKGVGKGSLLLLILSFVVLSFFAFFQFKRYLLKNISLGIIEANICFKYKFHAVGIFAITLLMLLVIRRAWVCDDAYITLRTVDNFIHGYGLVWNVAERVQTYTHPLWLLIVSMFYALTHEAYYTTLLLSLMVTCWSAVLLAFFAAPHPWEGAVGVIVLSFSSAFVDYATSGLENPLSHLLLGVFVILLCKTSFSPRRLLWLSLVASLASVNRLDTLLLYIPALLVALWQIRSWKGIGWFVLGQFPLLVWEVFSLIYYGFLFPNTAYAKLNTDIPTNQLVQQGLVYLLDAMQRDPILILLISMALIAPFLVKKEYAFSLAAGIVLYVIYIIKIGGDFMGGRLLTMPMFMAVLLLLQLDFASFSCRLLSPVLIVLFLAGSSAMTPSWRIYPLIGYETILPNGIADERAFYFQGTGLITAKRGVSLPTFPWRRDGEQLRQHGGSLVVVEAVGLLGYYAGAKVHLIDKLALTDPLLARLPAQNDPHWRIGHFRRKLPPGYIESVLTKKNLFQDENLGLYFEYLTLITQGNIFDLLRWKAIWKMNIGKYNFLINRGFYRFN